MENGLFIKTDDFTFSQTNFASNESPLKWLHASDCQNNKTKSFGSLAGTNLTFTSRFPFNGYKAFGTYRMVTDKDMIFKIIGWIKFHVICDLSKVCRTTEEA